MQLERLVGITGHAEAKVDAKITAVHIGSGSLPVLATPSMIALMEAACCNAIRDGLPLGMTTVGTNVQVKHLVATPIGHHIQAEASLIAVEGQRLTFKVSAYDEKEKIGEGIHERFLINAERFMQNIASKKQPAQ